MPAAHLHPNALRAVPLRSPAGGYPATAHACLRLHALYGMSLTRAQWEVLRDAVEQGRALAARANPLDADRPFCTVLLRTQRVSMVYDRLFRCFVGVLPPLRPEGARPAMPMACAWRA